jgi:transposase-like protein
VGWSWRVDEAHIKFKGQWGCLYLAVDHEGRTVDFSLNEHRDIAAAQAFWRKAIVHDGTP